MRVLLDWRSIRLGPAALLALGLAPATGSAQEPAFLVADLDLHGVYQHSRPQFLAVFGGLLYFSAEDGASGRELWRSDGTTAELVADILPGPEGSDPRYLVESGGLLYFSAADPAAGRELWRSDGTAAGTWRVADIVPGPDSSIPGGYSAINRPGDFSVVNGRLVFTASHPDYGVEFWGSDGTPAGTVRVAGGGLDAFTLPPTSGSALAQSLGSQGDLLFFNAADERGQELWAIPIPDCDDGIDNDGDDGIDFPDDPGCFNAEQPFENPACDDGISNGDEDLAIDFPDDPGCFAAWDGSEVDPPFCGLGFELAFLLPPLLWLHGQRRRRAL